jgi:hypothetical protein
VDVPTWSHLELASAQLISMDSRLTPTLPKDVERMQFW